MPELPEVETTRRGIADRIRGLTVESVEVRQFRLRLPVPEDFSARLEGAILGDTLRRAKYLLVESSSGRLLIHLCMSGSLRIADPTQELRKHDHVIWNLEGDRQLRYHDPRRFGIVTWAGTEAEPHSLIQGLGPEPIGNEDFDGDALGDHLYAYSRKKTRRLRDFLLDGRVVAGVGNIYANEAAWRAGIRPDRSCGRIARLRYRKLAHDLQDVLQSAVDKGGSTLRDFVDPEGQTGYFQHVFNVYGREGEPCHSCESEIVREVLSNRSLFYCRQCQR